MHHLNLPQVSVTVHKRACNGHGTHGTQKKKPASRMRASRKSGIIIFNIVVKMCIYAHRRLHHIRVGHRLRGKQLTGERARGKDRKKRGRRSDAKQSGVGMYYSAWGVPHFYCYSLDLTSPGIKVTLLPTYCRFASVRPEETTLFFLLSQWATIRS